MMVVHMPPRKPGPVVFSFIRIFYSSGAVSMSTARQQAIRAIATQKHQLNRIDFKTVHPSDLFGVNVFNEEVQKHRLPKTAFKALQKTIKQVTPLDPQSADSIANAM